MQFLRRYLHHRDEHFLSTNIHPNNHRLSIASNLITTTFNKKYTHCQNFPNRKILCIKIFYLNKSKLKYFLFVRPCPSNPHPLLETMLHITNDLINFQVYMLYSINNHNMNNVMKHVSLRWCFKLLVHVIQKSTINMFSRLIPHSETNYSALVPLDVQGELDM